MPGVVKQLNEEGAMATLDTLELMVKQLTEPLDSNMKSLRTEVTDLKDSIQSVETKLDTKIEGLRTSMNNEIKTLRDGFKAEIKTKVSEEITSVTSQVDGLKKELAAAKMDIERLTMLVESPFHPDRSVVLKTTPETESTNFPIKLFHFSSFWSRNL